MRRLSGRLIGSRGYISVVVLMFAGLLAALVAATLHVARPTVGYARLNTDDLQADWLLRGGVSAAAYSLYGARREPDKVTGTVLAFDTGSVRLKVVGEGGRIDLNGARRPLLEGIYRQAGGTAMRPEQFAGRVIDWRDRNPKPVPSGAELPDYRSAGLDYGPRNGPFQAVEELLLILDMTQGDFERLEPYITIFNPGGTIDPLSAPIPVLASVPRMDARQAETLVSALKAERPERRAGSRLLQRYQQYLAVGDQFVYRVGVEARLAGGYTKSVEAVIMETGDDNLYDVLGWVETSGGKAP